MLWKDRHSAIRYFPVHQILTWNRGALGAVDYYTPTPCRYGTQMEGTWKFYMVL